MRRSKVISVLAILIFYVLIFVFMIVYFPVVEGEGGWHELLATFLLIYGFIGFIVYLAYRSIKWVLKERKDDFKE